ncbi:hypothetical protein EC973_001620 [Apophysomyces ossiformis]|uniref:YAP binding domain-containing protein n=1 Tax=Apophysomyces ossiformis TaxID=679940 RepID=A0A8H7BYF0_9FUNG|nr:hypothetical protein EC973_001620 [Apophysomyces ossiformis]
MSTTTITNHFSSESLSDESSIHSSSSPSQVMYSQYHAMLDLPLFGLVDPLTFLNTEMLDVVCKQQQQQQKPVSSSSPSSSSSAILWPNYLCLYLEYTLPCDPLTTLSHNLAQLPQCSFDPMATMMITRERPSPKKCPPLAGLIQTSHMVLLAKVKLDLNLNLSDFVFSNTSFFETRDRRTIECTTSIYSFGNIVLESKEIQQALWISEGKYMYSFVYVNQFFDAFMKGIRSLQSWEEIDIAIQHLCIVQVFEDVEARCTQSKSSLLSMAYEFERGNGTMNVHVMGDSDDLTGTPHIEDMASII